jgi:hypothetical protein
MSKLKSFILSEEVRASHALKYFNYMEKYHDDIYDIVIDELKKQWVLVKKANKFEMPDDGRVEQLYLKSMNPDLSAGLNGREVTIKSPQFSHPVTSPLSYDISLAFTDVQRKRMIDAALDAAETAFNNVIKDNPAIFAHVDSAEKVRNLFNVVRHDETVRLQFKVTHKEGDDRKELAKTIFTVSVDHGKITSKTKHIDRVYMVDNTKR